MVANLSTFEELAALWWNFGYTCFVTQNCSKSFLGSTFYKCLKHEKCYLWTVNYLPQRTLAENQRLKEELEESQRLAIEAAALELLQLDGLQNSPNQERTSNAKRRVGLFDRDL